MLELLSLLLGGGLRLVPEFLKLWTAKRDQDHELRMTRLQLEIDTARAKLDIDKTHATADAAEQTAWAQALVESMKPQAPVVATGNWFVDVMNALSASVRPVLTYWHCLVLYTAYKVALLMLAIQSGTGALQAVANSFTAFDQALVLSMSSYWFLDRTLRNQR